MLIPRGHLLLLIYTGVLLLGGCVAPRRGQQEDSGRDKKEERRRQSRRQRNKDQEKASTSLMQAFESHSKYSASSNKPVPEASKVPSNRTKVIAPYYVSKYDHPKPDDIQVGCKELRSKRYISDGFCTSVKPITEVVCTGHCLPIRNLPWYAEFIKVWARTKVLEWRCVEDDIRRKKVSLLCENGEVRTYRIKVVKSCKCKRYMKPQNQSVVGLKKSSGNRRRRKGRREKKSRMENLSPHNLPRRNLDDL